MQQLAYLLHIVLFALHYINFIYEPQNIGIQIKQKQYTILEPVNVLNITQNIY